MTTCRTCSAGRRWRSRTKSRLAASQVKRQFIAGMPPKLRNALYMKNQPDTASEDLAKWVRKKFAANKLSGLEDQVQESFNECKATKVPDSTVAKMEAVCQAFQRGNENAKQYNGVKKEKDRSGWKGNGSRVFTPNAPFPVPPNWAAVAAAPPSNWAPYGYGLPQAPPAALQAANYYPQGGQAQGQHPPQQNGHGGQDRDQRNNQNNRGNGNQGQKGGQGQGRRRGDFSKTLCFGCAQMGHGVTQCPTFVLPFRPPPENGGPTGNPGQSQHKETANQAKAKQSKIPVDRVPAQTTINAAHAQLAEQAAHYNNWYAENAQLIEQIAAAQATFVMNGQEQPGVMAGADLDTDSSENE